MSYNDEKAKGYREYVEIFEIDLDINDPAQTQLANDPNSYGTPKTTDDPLAYKAGEFRTFRYSNVELDFDTHHYPNLDLSGTSSSPAQIKPGVDVSLSATARVKVKDFFDNDSYQLQPPYDDKRVGGSHFKLLLARNYLQNRPARIKRGYNPSSLSDSNFQIEHYVIKNVSFSKDCSYVTFDLVDTLFFASEGKAKIPVISDMTIDSSIPDATYVGNFNISGKTFGQKGLDPDPIVLDEDFYILIEDEILKGHVQGYNTSTFAGVFDIIERGVGGTVASAHGTGSLVQGCYAAENRNVVDIIKDIFQDFTKVKSSALNITKLDAQKADEFASYNLTTFITKPISVKDALKELIVSTGMWLYYDTLLDEIAIGITPRFNEPVVALNQDENILKDAYQITPKPELQVTRSVIRYEKRDYSKDNSAKNYIKGFRIQDDIAESDEEYGQITEAKEIISNWYTGSSADIILAQGTSQLKVERFRDIPNLHKFVLDSRDIGDLSNGERLWYGSSVRLFSSCELNPDGSNKEVIGQVVGIRKLSGVENFDKWEVQVLTYNSSDVIDDSVQVDHTITANAFNVNLYTLLGNPTEVREYIVVINPGVKIGSTSTSTYSIRCGNMPAGSSIKLINQGIIRGMGGNGGYGGENIRDGEVNVIIPPQNGFIGGPALLLECDLVLDNLQGLVGGGGAGGKGGQTSGSQGIDQAGTGGGGGGGAGSNIGTGGAGGIGDVPAEDGEDGTKDTGGDGGAPAGNFAFAGEDGGDLGQDTSTADAGNAITTGGFVLSILNGNNPNQIKGRIV